MSMSQQGNLAQRQAPLLSRLQDEAAADRSQPSGHAQLSGYRGVYFNGQTGLWQAGIAAHGRLVSLGAFGTDEGAARMYDRAALRVRGQKASLNFPRDDYVYHDGTLALDLQVEALLLEAFLARGIEPGEGGAAPGIRPPSAIPASAAVADLVSQCLGRINQADKADVQEAAEAMGSDCHRLMGLIADAYHLLQTPPAPAADPLPAGAASGRSGMMRSLLVVRSDGGVSLTGGDGVDSGSQGSGGSPRGGGSSGNSGNGSGAGPQGRAANSGRDGDGVGEEAEARRAASSYQGGAAANSGSQKSRGGVGAGGLWRQAEGSRMQQQQALSRSPAEAQHQRAPTQHSPLRQTHPRQQRHDQSQQRQQPRQTEANLEGTGPGSWLAAGLDSWKQPSEGLRLERSKPDGGRQGVAASVGTASAGAGGDDGAAAGSSRAAMVAAAAAAAAATPPLPDSALSDIPPIATPPFLPPNFMQNICTMLVSHIQTAQAAAQRTTGGLPPPPPPVVQAVRYLHACGLPLGMLLQGAAHLAAFNLVPAEDYQALNMAAWSSAADPSNPGSSLTGGLPRRSMPETTSGGEGAGAGGGVSGTTGAMPGPASESAGPPGQDGEATIATPAPLAADGNDGGRGGRSEAVSAHKRKATDAAAAGGAAAVTSSGGGGEDDSSGAAGSAEAVAVEDADAPVAKRVARERNDAELGAGFPLGPSAGPSAPPSGGAQPMVVDGAPPGDAPAATAGRGSGPTRSAGTVTVTAGGAPVDPRVALAMAAAAAAASAAGGVPVGIPVTPQEQIAAAAAVAAAAAAAMGTNALSQSAGLGGMPGADPAAVAAAVQRLIGARGVPPTASGGVLPPQAGPTPQHIGLGRRLFYAIASQLAPGAELDCLLPPQHGFVGLLYVPGPGSARVGAALWDGGTVRDLGVYSSDRDARQSVRSSARLLGASLATPRVSGGAGAQPQLQHAAARPAAAWHGAGGDAAATLPPPPLVPAGSVTVTEMSGGGGSFITAACQAVARNVLLQQAGSARGPMSYNSANLFMSAGGAGGGGGGGTSSLSGGTTGAAAPSMSVDPGRSRLNPATRPAGPPPPPPLQGRLSTAPSTATSPLGSLGGGQAAGRGNVEGCGLVPPVAALRSLVAASGAGGAMAAVTADQREKALQALLQQRYSFSSSGRAVPGLGNGPGVGPSREAAEAAVEERLPPRRISGVSPGGTATAAAAAAAPPELEAVGSSLPPPRGSVIGPFLVAPPDVLPDGSVNVTCQLVVPQDGPLTSDDVNNIISQSVTPAALQNLLDGALPEPGRPLSAALGAPLPRKTGAPAPAAAPPVTVGAAELLHPSSAAAAPPGPPAPGAPGWTASIPAVHGPPPMPFAIRSMSLLSGVDRSPLLNEAPSVRTPFRPPAQAPPLPPAGSRALLARPLNTAGGRLSTGGGTLHTDAPDARSNPTAAAAVGAASPPGDRPADAAGERQRRPPMEALRAAAAVAPAADDRGRGPQAAGPEAPGEGGRQGQEVLNAATSVSWLGSVAVGSPNPSARGAAAAGKAAPNDAPALRRPSAEIPQQRQQQQRGLSGAGETATVAAAMTGRSESGGGGGGSGMGTAGAASSKPGPSTMHSAPAPTEGPATGEGRPAATRAAGEGGSGARGPQDVDGGGKGTVQSGAGRARGLVDMGGGDAGGNRNGNGAGVTGTADGSGAARERPGGGDNYGGSGGALEAEGRVAMEGGAHEEQG